MKKINCILLVDDNSTDNVFHEIVIREAGVCENLQIVTGGEEALNYIRAASVSNDAYAFPMPDLVYLDINMPKMNGFDFLDAYKKLEENIKSRITIIMLTTSLNPADRIKAFSYKEVTDFQNKPLTVAMLKQAEQQYFTH